MRAFRSIRWRLQFWYALLLAAVLLGFGLSAYEIERNDLQRATDAELGRRVDSLARALRPPPPAPPPVRRPPERLSRETGRDDGAGDDPGPPPRPPEPVPPGADANPALPGRLARRIPAQEQADYETAGPGGWYYALWQRNGEPAASSPSCPPDLPRPTLFARRPQEPVLRARGSLREAYTRMGQGELLLVGHDLTADLLRLHHLAWLMAGAAGAILGLGLIGGHWLAGRSLQPIADIGAAAAKIAAGDLRQRIGTEDTDSELGQLAQVLDATFARLEAAFARQARFTADAAHELRTPLAVVLTHTQNALAVPCASEEHREALAACQRAAQRMRALTESLLWLARLDSGSQVRRRVAFDLAERVADCVELLRPLAGRRGITVRSDLAPAPCAGDPEQIDQVITNLITNAIEHNSEGGEIRIATQARPAGATLAVADRGPGIAADQLPRVFDRFYRTDASRSRASGGVGLGLAIAKAIVEAHGGTIRAESEPGRGAVFTASFPC
jgi:heavy metal sensor kinase